MKTVHFTARGLSAAGSEDKPTIMFNRLGIPLEGLAMAIRLELILDYLGTACDTFGPEHQHAAYGTPAEGDRESNGGGNSNFK